MPINLLVIINDDDDDDNNKYINLIFIHYHDIIFNKEINFNTLSI